MNRLPCLLAACCMFSTVHAEDDLLRFENSDQLHGSFLGLTEGGAIRFQNKEMKEPAEFRVDTLRHMVFRGGRPGQSSHTLTHVCLTNGDRIPGTVVAMDASLLTLDTGFMGVLRIPRAHISMIATNPMGGRIHYYGPFSQDGWSTIQPSSAAGDDNGPPSSEWQFSGSSWYWKGSKPDGARINSQTRGALVRREGLADRSIMRFRLDWREQFGISIAFHADFATGDPAKDDDAMKQSRAQGSLPSVFGNAYVLQIYASYIMLYRSSWDPERGPQYDRIQTSSTSLRLNDARSATVEIRGNRQNGRISLFINDEFLTQWNEPPAAADGESYAGKGNGYGFSIQQGSGSVRISEILVSDWNGLPDSARSMELDESDVILMNNGVDRFSGEVGTLDADGRLGVQTRHTPMMLPLADTSEIRFARARLSKPTEEEQGSSFIHISPIGQITCKLLSGDADKIRIRHPLLGEVDCQTTPLVMIEYKKGSRIADQWNDDL